MAGFEILFFFILIAAAVIVGAIYSHRAEKKRQQDLMELATRLGLSFTPERSRQVASRYAFLDRLGQGSNRYAFNVLSGTHQGERVVAFDYHYETHSTDSKGRRQTHHHYLSCFVMDLPIDCPELLVGRESLLSKIAQALGYDDIDFESAEFSRAFCVRSKDRRFAYDICNPQMMEYLLANRDLNIEIENTTLALLFAGRIAVSECERNLDRLTQIRALIPDYLFTTT
jgi:hypothetical protein